MAERGVESLFGGSKRAGCDYSLVKFTIGELSRLCHGEGHVRCALRQGGYRPAPDDWVALCRSEAEAKAALHAAGEILAGLGLELHPEKTRIVDLREGRQGFDFLGWHFRARVSGRLLERGIRRYYLHRWPSQRAMKRVRGKVEAKTGRNRCGVKDIRVVIDELNPILRGWGNYFRTVNAADKFFQLDRYAGWRLKRLMIKRKGRNLRAGQASRWTEDWFVSLGLHRLRGTIRHPGTA